MSRLATLLHHFITPHVVRLIPHQDLQELKQVFVGLHDGQIQTAEWELKIAPLFFPDQYVY